MEKTGPIRFQVHCGGKAMIEGYGFGRITVRGTLYTSDLIIYPDHVDDRWWRREGHVLCPDDLQDVFAAQPEVLVVGTGAEGLMQVTDDVRSRLAELGIELHVAKTEEAGTLYNELAPQKKAVAALHLTC